jgi:hypothetical protein
MISLTPKFHQQDRPNLGGFAKAIIFLAAFDQGKKIVGVKLYIPIFKKEPS